MKTKTIATIGVLLVGSAAAYRFLSVQHDNSEMNESDQVVITDLKVGTGPEPKVGQTITVDYTSKVQGAKEYYASTRKSGQPFTYVVGSGQVLPGWEDGMKGMKEGGLRKIKIPPRLAYGSKGSGDNVIPPNAYIELEVTLLRVIPPEQ